MPENPAGRMKVLIAEDSAVARVMLETTLSSLGYEWITARDGDSAWELFLRYAPDVVISDWLMPGLDGDELCRRVREHQDGSYTYFILLTSLTAQAHVVRGMEAGADDYLHKPVDSDDLHSRLIAAERVNALHERLRAQQTELEALNRTLFEESRHDPLTRVGNRIALREHLTQLSGTAERHRHDYCIALYDVDKFKVFNDSQGHLAGDRVLCAIADALGSRGRSGDAVYRYGGEEFVVVLPGQTLENAASVAERIRQAVLSLAIPHPACGAGALVTVSGGVARLEQSDAGDFEAVLKRADAALYRAKNFGRNRVDTSDPEPIPG
jgi:two-component system cell cycle response regulator